MHQGNWHFMSDSKIFQQVEGMMHFQGTVIDSLIDTSFGLQCRTFLVHNKGTTCCVYMLNI